MTSSSRSSQRTIAILPPLSWMLFKNTFRIVEGLIAPTWCARSIPAAITSGSLTCMSGKDSMSFTHLSCGANITYDNGAVVRTEFVTNLPSEYVLESAPELGRIINEVTRNDKSFPRYEYLLSVMTSAICEKYARRGIDYKVRRSQAVRISALNAQKAVGKSIFGGGLLLSVEETAKREAADKTAPVKREVVAKPATVWSLSERERMLQRSLG